MISAGRAQVIRELQFYRCVNGVKADGCKEPRVAATLGTVPRNQSTTAWTQPLLGVGLQQLPETGFPARTGHKEPGLSFRATTIARGNVIRGQDLTKAIRHISAVEFCAGRPHDNGQLGENRRVVRGNTVPKDKRPLSWEETSGVCT